MVALMGKNGAGKSTLLRILARISAPTDGSALFKGRNLFSGSATDRQGLLYIGHAPGLYPVLSARENLSLFAGFHNVQITPADIDEALALVGLLEQADDQIRIYSQGMLQRLKLCMAILIDWDLLLFDEPFAGLDAQGRVLVEGIFSEWRRQKRTMLLVVHDLDWAWDQCSRLVLLANGNIDSEFDLAEADQTAVRNIFREVVG